MAMKKTEKGFTLLEMLLVLVIVSSVFVLFMNYTTQRMTEFRRDRVSLQMQQILNASLAYYVNVGSWPTVTVTSPNNVSNNLQNNSAYLQSGSILNPWGQPYVISYPNFTTVTGPTGAPTIAITTDVLNATQAQIIAGRLPLASVSGTSVVAQVPIPGQNLNNARAANFASIYNSGACVPAPICPSGMSPSILVVPVQVYGAYDAPTGCTYNNDPTNCSQNVYPISGYAAYAYGPEPVESLNTCANANPAAGGTCYTNCLTTGNTSANCTKMNNTSHPGNYYRVCLSVKTDKGDVTPNTIAWGRLTGSVLAITRCVPTSETSGSGFTVWAP